MLNARTVGNEDPGIFGSPCHMPGNKLLIGEEIACSPWEGLYLEQAYAYTTSAH